MSDGLNSMDVSSDDYLPGVSEAALEEFIKRDLQAETGVKYEDPKTTGYVNHSQQTNDPLYFHSHQQQSPVAATNGYSPPHHHHHHHASKTYSSRLLSREAHCLHYQRSRRELL